MKKNSYYLYLLIAVTSVFILIGFFTYFHKFNGELSNNDQNWSSFSTFMSLFVNLASLILIGYISFITFYSTNKFNELTHRPFLDLTVQSTSEVMLFNIVKVWYIFNCTNAAARNIKLVFWMNNNTKSKFIICYSVPGNKMIELNWLHYISKYEIYYSDILEENFYKLTYQNLGGITTEISHEEFNEIQNKEFFSCTELELRFSNFLKTQTSFNQNIYNEFLDINDLIII